MKKKVGYSHIFKGRNIVKYRERADGALRWRPRVNEYHVTCPHCGNTDGETLCEIRSMFFQCEAKKCGRYFDAEMSL